jgi:cell division protein FtsQ
MTARAASRSPFRYAVAFLATVALVGSLAVLAGQWRRHAVGVTVAVRGAMHVQAKDVLRRAAVPDTAILADIDLLDVKRRVERLPLVREARVQRDPPSTLVIELVERQPAAILLNVQGTDWVLSDDSVFLPCVGTLSKDDLPAITGYNGAVTPGGRVKDSRLLAALAVIRSARALGDDVLELFSEISIEQPRDILLYTTEDAVPIILGDAGDLDRKLRSFRSFWETIAVKTGTSDLEYVDLRFHNQVVVRWLDERYSGTAPERPDTTIVLSD